jgi:hypothetical protein
MSAKGRSINEYLWMNQAISEGKRTKGKEYKLCIIHLHENGRLVGGALW